MLESLLRSVKRYARIAVLGAAMSAGCGGCDSEDTPDASDAAVQVDADLEAAVEELEVTEGVDETGVAYMNFSNVDADVDSTNGEEPEFFMDFSQGAMVFDPAEVIASMPAEQEHTSGKNETRYRTIFSLTYTAMRAKRVHNKRLPLMFGFGTCESGFHPDVISRSGAAGVYQIMPKKRAYLRDFFHDGSRLAVFGRVSKSGRSKRAREYRVRRDRIARELGIRVITRGNYSFTQFNPENPELNTRYLNRLFKMDWRMHPYYNALWATETIDDSIRTYRRRGHSEANAIALAARAYNAGPGGVRGVKHALRNKYVRCVAGRAKVFAELGKNKMLTCRGITAFAEAEHKRVVDYNRKLTRKLGRRLRRREAARPQIGRDVAVSLCTRYVVSYSGDKR